MENFTLQADEVILYEGSAVSKNYKGTVLLTLTSQKIIVEKEKGFIKKQRELIDCFSLEDIKIYDETVQIKQKGSLVELQTIQQNINFEFSGMFEARKFVGKVIDVITGTTLAKRSSEKVKDALDMVDDTLGVDTRGAIKGVLENGIKGVIFNGFKK